MLRHLLETNDQKSITYGFDGWSERAKAKIEVACEASDAQVFFLT